MLDKSKISYVIFVIMTAGIMYPITFIDTGLGQDDAAIILASTRQFLFSPFTSELFDNLFFNLFNYSHGWLNLVLTDLVYLCADFFNVPLYTCVLIFPSTFCIWLTTFIIYACVKDTTKNVYFAVITALIFLSIPILVGIARSYTITVSLALCIRTMLVFFLFRFGTGDTKSRRYVLICAGFLICSDNTFPVFVFLSLLYLFFVHLYRVNKEKGVLTRGIASLIAVIQFFWTPWSLVPLWIFGGYVATYLLEEYFPYGLGYFRYTISRDPNIDFGIPNSFWSRYFDHLGVGMGVLLPVFLILGVILLFDTALKKLRLEILFLFLWIVWGGLSLFLYEPRDNAFIYLPLLLPPVCILIGFILYRVHERLHTWVRAVTTGLIGTNVLFAYSLVFGFPFDSPNLYGLPESYYYSRAYKAAGTILRSEGDRFDRHRGVVLAGLCEGQTSHVANFYMGGYTLSDPKAVNYNGNNKTQIGPETQVVVVTGQTNGCPEKKQQILRFIEEKHYVLKHVIQDGGEPVVWIYYQNGDPHQNPQEHDKQFLMAEWDQKFARIAHLIGRSGAL